MIKKYRKKPVEIEALQWTYYNGADMLSFLGESFHRWVDHEHIEINTLEGIITATVGDFLIKGVQGEFYPCKPDIFEQTYDEVHDEREN